MISYLSQGEVAIPAPPMKFPNLDWVRRVFYDPALEHIYVEGLYVMGPQGEVGRVGGVYSNIKYPMGTGINFDFLPSDAEHVAVLKNDELEFVHYQVFLDDWGQIPLNQYNEKQEVFLEQDFGIFSAEKIESSIREALKGIEAAKTMADSLNFSGAQHSINIAQWSRDQIHVSSTILHRLGILDNESFFFIQTDMLGAISEGLTKAKGAIRMGSKGGVIGAAVNLYNLLDKSIGPMAETMAKKRIQKLKDTFQGQVAAYNRMYEIYVSTKPTQEQGAVAMKQTLGSMWRGLMMLKTTMDARAVDIGEFSSKSPIGLSGLGAEPITGAMVVIVKVGTFAWFLVKIALLLVRLAKLMAAAAGVGVTFFYVTYGLQKLHEPSIEEQAAKVRELRAEIERQGKTDPANGPLNPFTQLQLTAAQRAALAANDPAVMKKVEKSVRDYNALNIGNVGEKNGKPGEGGKEADKKASVGTVTYAAIAAGVVGVVVYAFMKKK